MADPALDSHRSIVDQFLREWDNYPAVTADQRARRREWVRTELQRAKEAGVAPLFFALTRPLADQVDTCLAVLAEDRSPVWLRLVEGAAPPETDPQGRPLQPQKRGKTLVAKLGNVSDDGMTGTKRLQPGRDLYRTVEITRDPQGFTIDEAAIVLRQWGVNVRPNEHYRSGERMQSRWLVVQVDRSGQPFASADTQPEQPKQGKR